MDTKKQFKWFTIFEYDKEQDYLREMHKSGWKFVKVKGLGMYHFEKCVPQDVVYQLDYNQEGLAHKEEYLKMLLKEGIQKEEEDTREILTFTGKIAKIAQGVVEGNSHYYVMIEGSEDIFDISVVDMIQIIKYEIGQEITVEYRAGEEVNTVLAIK